jgi:hypothetical protein
MTPTKDLQTTQEVSKGGRPLKIKDVATLNRKINNYFRGCFEMKWFDEKARDIKGKIKYDTRHRPIYKAVRRRVQVKPITITGLALALDCSRDTLLEYQGRHEYSDTIKKAKDFCHNYVENGMMSGEVNPTAAIFNLKNNYGWVDKTETESKGLHLHKHIREYANDFIDD